VTNVHDLTLGEATAYRRVEKTEDASAVDERCLAAARGRFRAAEPNLRGPTLVEGVLVVPEELPLGRVEDRRVDVAADAAARVLAVLVEEVGAEGRGEPLEVRGRGHVEAAEEDCAVAQQFLL